MSSNPPRTDATACPRCATEACAVLGDAAEEALAMVAAVRHDPALRLGLASRFYDDRPGRASIRAYRCQGTSGLPCGRTADLLAGGQVMSVWAVG